MGEKLTGHDILERVPLSELLLPRDEALDRLYDYTLDIARFNYGVLVDHAYQLDPPWPSRIRREVTPEFVDEHISLLPRGGSALVPDDLDIIYDNFSRYPFSRLFRHYLKDRISPIFKKQAKAVRQPGVVAVGMMTDLKRILRPEQVETNSVFPFMIKYMRPRPGLTHILSTPFSIGMCLDDTIRLQVGTESNGFIDPRADKLGAIELLEAYMQVGTEAEKQQMLAGFHITFEQIQELLRKSSRKRPPISFSLN